MNEQRINSREALEEAIYLLEQRRKVQWIEIKEHTYIVAESMKPANLAKQALADFMVDRNLKKVLKQAASLGAGALVQQLAVRNTNNSFLRFAGRILQITVTNMVDRVLNK
jgi:hypothetical protein